MTTGTATAAASGTPSAQSLSRFNRQAAQQGSQAAVNLALLEAETTQAGAGGTPQAQAQDGHPSVQRLAGDQWQGMTGQVNNAQAAQGAESPGSVWVTVPADRVTVAPTGAHTVAPVYATPKGYRAKPGESAGSIPPPMAVKR